jgi:hypothetical protein
MQDMIRVVTSNLKLTADPISAAHAAGKMTAFLDRLQFAISKLTPRFFVFATCFAAAGTDCLYVL